ncbi:MAG: mucoidy inhibitor MuiA family protein, partial [Flavobacteriales bacterium]|nr:mucoidy inhibitor MuiA family protein [Flavobacteriales bacterium]
MKFFPPLALFIALLFTTLVQSQELKVVELPIQEVTVFLNQAQVSRSGELVLPSGKVNVQIKGITSRINPNSIIVEGNVGYTILGVKHEQLFDEAANMSKNLKSKLDSLDDVNFEISTKVALEGVYNDEMAFLTENRSVKGDEAVMLVEDLEEMANFRRERVKEVQFRLIEVRMEQNDLRKTASRLQQEINKLSGNQRQNQSAITISLNVNQSGKSKLSFSYVVYDASWVPLYDIRAKSTSEDVVLSYKGKVRQATGNDWNNVKLTLSSG